jgi:NAD(P)-dependent dehydrogenase (short-subunit alcohol dehydrogenase family)
MQQVLVTGASGGIGRAIAVSLAERGARVAVHYNSDRAAAEETRRALNGTGHILCCADLSDARAIEPFWREVTAAFNRVDALVNNAGIYDAHPPATAEYAAWNEVLQRTVATNLLGPARLSFFAARSMAEQGSGRIVNISSRGAFRGEPTAPAYAASKAALNALGQSFAKAFASKGVQVFAVAPGWVSTERVAAHVQDPVVLADQPLGRVASPEEVAKVVTFCVLDAPASLTGAVLDVNGASYLR